MTAKLLEEQVAEFFKVFTEDGETVALDDVLDAVPHCGLSIEDPSLMRILVLLDEAGVSKLTLPDLHTLFDVQDPPSEADRMAVFVDPGTSFQMSFQEFIDRTN